MTASNVTLQPEFEKIEADIHFSGNVLFSVYADNWLETSELKPKTLNQYLFLTQRIYSAIGHIPLEELNAFHLKKFYANLRKDIVLTRKCYATSICLSEYRLSKNITMQKLAAMSDLSINTIREACAGRHIALKSAEKIAVALYEEINTLFSVKIKVGKLSDKTRRHYHTFIRTVLASAKREQLVPHNVAAENVKTPKHARSKFYYYSDVEARQFIAALDNENDSRIKTALTIILFTGMRRGELLGLEWSDFDFQRKVLQINRASQYICGKGIIEVPPKNDSSVREIQISAFVVDAIQEYKKWWNDYRRKLGKNWLGKKDRLFVSKNGKPLFPDTINRWLNKLLNRNNLPKITPHGLRHTFITLQITAGVDLRTLQSRTGHAQASTLLDTYSHVVQSAQDSATKSLDRVLLQNSSDNTCEVEPDDINLLIENVQNEIATLNSLIGLLEKKATNQ